MDYKELIENHDFSSPAKVADWIWNATCAITDLLARAEAAEARAEKAERERDDAVETIFKWTGCAECKHWKSDTDWCEKHDRYATISDGCSTPEWRGIKEE